jgi:hypothetical protein
VVELSEHLTATADRGKWAITTELPIRRLVLRAASSLAFAIAGLAGDALGFPLVGNLLVEAIDDVLKFLSVAQLFSFGSSHLAFHRHSQAGSGTRRYPYPAVRLVTAQTDPT